MSVELPWQRLEHDTLVRLLEEYVTRESTDSGVERELSARVAEVLQALRQNKARLVFDAATESCTVVSNEAR